MSSSLELALIEAIAEDDIIQLRKYVNICDMLHKGIDEIEGYTEKDLPSDEKYEEATNMKMEIVAAMEQELVLENMVKSLGFSDAVVSVSTDSDNVNVFINSLELNYDTALSIYNMMKNETGIVAGNVIIMPVYAES